MKFVLRTFTYCIGQQTVANGSTGIAALASAGEDDTFAPVQVQKFFFLIDREGARLGGPHFHFMPYDHGPFDSAVYEVLDLLATREYVRIDLGGRYRHYSLTNWAL